MYTIGINILKQDNVKNIMLIYYFKERGLVMKAKTKKSTIIIRIAVIIGVVVIPLLYSYFYLHSFWDPYADLQDVPVAVVNMDKGAEMNGKSRNVGDEVCKSLKENGTFKFVFTDKADAEKGVLGSEYYAEILIPSDFSSNVSTASKDTEKLQSTIKYYANQKKNYIASQIIGYAVPQIKEAVNASIDSEIVNTLSDKISSVPSQLTTLQSGLGQLSDGSATLKSGTSTLDSGSTQLVSGASQLKAGTQQLNDKVPTLSSGVYQLNKGASQLSNSLGLITKNNYTLTSGGVEVSSGVDKLISTMNTSTKSIIGGLGTLETSIGSDTAKNTLINGAKQMKDGTQLLNSAVSEAAASDSNVTLTTEQLNTIGTQGASGAAAYSDNFASGICTSVSANISSGAEAAGTMAAATASANILKDTDAQQMVAALTYTYMSKYSYSQADAQAAAEKAVKALASGVAKSTASSTVTDVAQQVSGSSAAVSAALSPNLQSLGSGIAKSTATGVVADVNKGLKAKFTLLSSSTKQLASGSSALYNGMVTLGSGVSSFKNQVASQASDADTVAQLNALSVGAKSLSDGIKIYAGGVTSASSGAKKIAAGTRELNSSIPALSSGVSALNTGAGTLLSGLNTLKSGTSQLDSGAGKLNDGLIEAKTGVDASLKSANSQIGALDGLGSYVANNPVDSTSEYVEPVDNYGNALAPYFMGLSLWVGGLMIFFGIYLDYNNQIPSLTKDSKKYVRRALSFLGIGALQAIMLAVVIKFVLKINVANMGLFLLASLLTSMAFISIIQFFIVHLGDIGKFLALLALILQLTSCAGIFPIETNPVFFRTLYKFMPMTYSTKLIKEALAGTWGSEANKDITVLVCICAVFMGLTMLVSGIKLARQRKKQNGSTDSIANSAPQTQV